MYRELLTNPVFTMCPSKTSWGKQSQGRPFVKKKPVVMKVLEGLWVHRLWDVSWVQSTLLQWHFVPEKKKGGLITRDGKITARRKVKDSILNPPSHHFITVEISREQFVTKEGRIQSYWAPCPSFTPIVLVLRLQRDKNFVRLVFSSVIEVRGTTFERDFRLLKFFRVSCLYLLC